MSNSCKRLLNQIGVILYVNLNKVLIFVNYIENWKSTRLDSVYRRYVKIVSVDHRNF